MSFAENLETWKKAEKYQNPLYSYPPEEITVGMNPLNYSPFKVFLKMRANLTFSDGFEEAET